mmetsp:Transcript_95169/g.116518  ORF Transcript_95169/g.116518 Transcript_95169/m.116518 type:complete len:388 (+) Transcript_95169:479-1642(+)
MSGSGRGRKRRILTDEEKEQRKNQKNAREQHRRLEINLYFELLYLLLGIKTEYNRCERVEALKKLITEVYTLRKHNQSLMDQINNLTKNNNINVKPHKPVQYQLNRSKQLCILVARKQQSTSSGKSQSRAKLRDLLKKFKNDIKDHGKPIPIFVKKGSIPDSPETFIAKLCNVKMETPKKKRKKTDSNTNSSVNDSYSFEDEYSLTPKNEDDSNGNVNNKNIFNNSYVNNSNNFINIPNNNIPLPGFNNNQQPFSAPPTILPPFNTIFYNDNTNLNQNINPFSHNNSNNDNNNNHNRNTNFGSPLLNVPLPSISFNQTSSTSSSMFSKGNMEQSFNDDNLHDDPMFQTPTQPTKNTMNFNCIHNDTPINTFPSLDGYIHHDILDDGF